MCIARFWNHQNDKKFGQVLVKLQTLYTERCIWDYTNTWRKKPTPPPPPSFTSYMTYLEYKGIWRAMLFREHVLSDVLPHLHNKNDNARKLFFTSSQNSTFSLIPKHDTLAAFTPSKVWDFVSPKPIAQPQSNKSFLFLKNTIWRAYPPMYTQDKCLWDDSWHLYHIDILGLRAMTVFNNERGLLKYKCTWTVSCIHANCRATWKCT